MNHIPSSIGQVNAIDNTKSFHAAKKQSHSSFGLRRQSNSSIETDIENVHTHTLLVLLARSVDRGDASLVNLASIIPLHSSPNNTGRYQLAIVNLILLFSPSRPFVDDLCCLVDGANVTLQTYALAGESYRHEQRDYCFIRTSFVVGVEFSSTDEFNDTASQLTGARSDFCAHFIRIAHGAVVVAIGGRFSTNDAPETSDFQGM